MKFKRKSREEAQGENTANCKGGQEQMMNSRGGISNVEQHRRAKHIFMLQPSLRTRWMEEADSKSRQKEAGWMREGGAG